MTPLVGMAGVNMHLQGLRAPSVAGAEPPSSAPIDGEGPAMGGELGDMGRWHRGWREEALEGEDGGGETGKGIGCMVVSILAGGDGFRYHEVFWVNLGVIFIPDELELSVFKHLGQFS